MGPNFSGGGSNLMQFYGIFFEGFSLNSASFGLVKLLRCEPSNIVPEMGILWVQFVRGFMLFVDLAGCIPGKVLLITTSWRLERSDLERDMELPLGF